MSKKTAMIFPIIVLLSFAIVAADYFRIFGTREKTILDFVELNFKTVDQDTGAPVNDVHIRCFQKRNDNACSEKESPGLGMVSVSIPIKKTIIRSMFFEHNTRVEETADPELHIMFIHYNFNNLVKTFLVKEIPDMKGQMIKVALPKATH